MPYKDPEQHRAACARYRAAHRREARAYDQARRAASLNRVCSWRTTHPEAGYLNGARMRAKAAGVPCTLTLADAYALLAPMRCNVTGLLLVRGRGGSGPLSPTLDRIVPGLGYVPGNVRLVCHAFNRLRGTADVSRDAEFRDRVLAELGEVQA